MPIDSLGEYLDPQVLQGHVKLEQGAGIVLTRYDPHNSIVIASIGLAPALTLRQVPPITGSATLENPTFSLVTP